MAFKLVKIAVIMAAGMFLAPKKGSELRADFVKMLKKYNKQIKEMVNKIEIVWEKSQGVESDEVAADIELRIKNVKGAVSVLDSASTKEMAYKALKKVDQAAVRVVKAAAHSPNVRSIAKDLAKMTVTAIDAGIKVYDDIKKTSSSFADRIIETGEEQNEKEKVIKIDESKEIVNRKPRSTIQDNLEDKVDEITIPIKTKTVRKKTSGAVKDNVKKTSTKSAKVNETKKQKPIDDEDVDVKVEEEN